jgi:hypothetical protein
MIKFIKNTATILLVLFLASCNINQSSSATSSANTSATSSSSVISSGVVNNLAITATGSLQQVLGFTSPIRVKAESNNNSLEAANIEWYIDGVRSLTQNTANFEFVPSIAKTYQVQAKIGSVSSNILTVGVELPSISLLSVSALNNNTIEIVADQGITFSINNVLISSNSYYNLVTKKYVLTLLSTLQQGTTYPIVMTKTGHKDLVYSFRYDTRKIEVSTFEYDGEIYEKGTDGYYTIFKPFTGESNKTYGLSVKQTNLEGSNVVVKVETRNESGVAYSGISDYQSSLNIVSGINFEYDFTLTASSLIGVYVHKISIGSFSVDIKVRVVEPTATLDLVGDVLYDDEIVKPQTNGSYKVTKPYNGSNLELTFQVNAEYFSMPVGWAPGSNPHYFTYSLSPVIYYNTNTINTYYANERFEVKFLEPYELTIFIDETTLAGTYTFTFSAGAINASTIVNKNVTIVIEQFSPKTEVLIEVAGEEVVANNDGSYSIFKPLIGGPTDDEITTSVKLLVYNYESPEVFTLQPGVEAKAYEFEEEDPRYFLTYRVRYTGPIAGITEITSKVGIELGVPIDGASEFDNDEVEVSIPTPEVGTPEYNRYLGEFNRVEIDISEDVAYIATLTPTSVQGVHTYTVTIGNLTRTIVFNLIVPSPRLITKDDSVMYGVEDSESSDNVTYVAAESTYYVEGTGGNLKVNVYPFGYNSGSYTYTFSKLDPIGNFSSSSNFVELELKTGVDYDGTSTFPEAGQSGADMGLIGFEGNNILDQTGLYTYTFIIGGQTKVIKLVVLPLPGFEIIDITYNDESLTKFEDNYLIVNSDVARTLNFKLRPVNVKEDYSFNISTDDEDDTNPTIIETNVNEISKTFSFEYDGDLLEVGEFGFSSLYINIFNEENEFVNSIEIKIVVLE